MSNIVYVYVENLEDFMREVLPGDVRLILTQKKTAQNPILQHQYSLILTGTNTKGEILVLVDRVTVGMNPTGEKAWTPGGESIISQVPTWKNLVSNYLKKHGYTVYPGMVAIPEQHSSVIGSFATAAVWSCVSHQNNGIGDGWCETWIMTPPSQENKVVAPMPVAQVIRLAYCELSNRIEADELGVEEESLDLEMQQLEAFAVASGFKDLDAALRTAAVEVGNE